MDAVGRARELALLGIEVRATQSQNTGTGGGYQPPHVPAGSSKGGQFGTTAGTPTGAGSGIGSMPQSTYKSGGGKAKSKASAPANTPQPPTTSRTMKVGDSGEDVRYAQYAMNLLGFKVAQNGQYGPETEAAVKQMQERLGVAKPNGHLSPSMLHKMQDAVRLSPCVGAGQRDLEFEAAWEARDIEDVDDDVPDEDTEALIAALGEFIGDDERSFSEALHPRNPKGSAGGGRFRSIVDRVVDALSEWKKGDGPDDPLKDFNREQLLKAAKAHGHTFRRGAPIEEIKAQILDDVRNGTKAAKAEAPNLPGAPKDHRRFTIQLAGKADPAAVREVEVENKIRAAYAKLRRPDGPQWVGLAELRGEMGDTPRADVDKALIRLLQADRPGDNRLIPEENQKSITKADEAAALDVSGEAKHLISIKDPSPRPLPKSGTATDVGIFAAPSTGKLSLYRESDTGKRTGRAIKSFDDMGALESWARDNGHTELADYAKAEQAKTGAPSAPAAKKATKAAPKLSTDPAVREVEVENKIRAAYVKHKLAGGYAPLADVRDELSGIPRAEQDAALKRLATEPGVSVIPWDNRKALTTRDHAAAVRVGGDENHVIRFEDSSPRPLPGPDPAAILSSLPSDLTPAQKRARLRSRGVPKEQIDALVPLKARTKAARSFALRALGHDVTPGHDELHHYWTVGPGLAKWAESPKPWTTLVAHLTKYVGPEKAKVYASRWFIEVFHFAAGSDLNRVTHGKPPRGHRVGPG